MKLKKIIVFMFKMDLLTDGTVMAVTLDETALPIGLNVEKHYFTFFQIS